MVRDSGSLASWHVGVGFAGHDDGDSLGGQGYVKAARKREGDFLFYEVAGDACTGVGASVSSVDDDRKSWLHGEVVCRQSRQSG